MLAVELRYRSQSDGFPFRAVDWRSYSDSSLLDKQKSPETVARGCKQPGMPEISEQRSLSIQRRREESTLAGNAVQLVPAEISHLPRRGNAVRLGLAISVTSAWTAILAGAVANRPRSDTFFIAHRFDLMYPSVASAGCKQHL